MRSVWLPIILALAVSCSSDSESSDGDSGGDPGGSEGGGAVEGVGAGTGEGEGDVAGAAAGGEQGAGEGAGQGAAGEGGAGEGGGHGQEGGGEGDGGGEDVAEGEGEGEGEGEEACVDAERFLIDELWGPVLSKCVGCHNDYGLATGPPYLAWGLGFGGDPATVRRNVATLRSMAFDLPDLEDPYLVLKPTLQVPHEGGAVLDMGSAEYLALKEFAERSAADDFPDCQDEPADLFAGVAMRDDAETLYKAQIALIGAPPTQAELEALEAGGDLDAVLEALMDRPEFYQRLEDIFGDLLLTDGLLGIGGRSIVPTARLRPSQYPDRMYFYPCAHASNPGFCCEADHRGAADRCCGNDASTSGAFCDVGEEGVARFLSREPLKLISHVVRSDRPFTEILTADYTLVNPYTAKVYSVDDVEFDDPDDPEEYRPAQLVSAENMGRGVSTEIPHSGVVTSHIFMNRYRTSPTNLNRHRVRTVYDMFLDVDVPGLVEFTVGQDEDLPDNPTMDATSCRVCHAVMDPPAGAFRQWDSVGRWRLGRPWMVCGQDEDDPAYDPTLCVRPSGYQGEVLPDEALADSLGWLLDRIAADERFALATVQTLAKGLMGLETLKVPKNAESPDYRAKLWAYKTQAQVFDQVVRGFIASDYRLKGAIKALIAGPYFRAWNVAQGAPEAQRAALLEAQVGGSKLLTPEQLHRRIAHVTGYPWRFNDLYTQDDMLLAGTRLRVLYGGLDYASVTHRTREPFPVQTSAARRMANAMSCLAVPQDFAWNDTEARRFFGGVTPEMAPEDEAGAPTHTAEIRDTIRFLHYRFLGERLDNDAPAVNETFQLFSTVWREGLARVEAGAEQPVLAPRCRANRDWETRSPIDDDPARTAVLRDDSYVIRAWMAVVSYLLSDYRFLFE